MRATFSMGELRAVRGPHRDRDSPGRHCPELRGRPRRLPGGRGHGRRASGPWPERHRGRGQRCQAGQGPVAAAHGQARVAPPRRRVRVFQKGRCTANASGPAIAGWKASPSPPGRRSRSAGKSRIRNRSPSGSRPKPIRRSASGDVSSHPRNPSFSSTKLQRSRRPREGRPPALGRPCAWLGKQRGRQPDVGGARVRGIRPHSASEGTLNFSGHSLGP
jgi:hypothetical protein